MLFGLRDLDDGIVKLARARDLWHLGNRLLRTALMHTVAVLLNGGLGNLPMRLAQLVASATFPVTEVEQEVALGATMRG